MPYYNHMLGITERPNEMNVYECSAEQDSGCGCCRGETYEAIVVANTKEEALGFLLERFTHTTADDWYHIEQIDITKAGIANY